MDEPTEQELHRLRRRNAELEAAIVAALDELLAPRSLLERLERVQVRLSDSALPRHCPSAPGVRPEAGSGAGRPGRETAHPAAAPACSAAR